MADANYRTGFIFRAIGFLKGIGSIMNIAGNYSEFNYPTDSREADAQAIENDWKAISEDLIETVKENPSRLDLAFYNL